MRSARGLAVAALAGALAVGLSRAGRAATPEEVVPAGSDFVIELVDWSDRVAGPYLGKACTAMNDLWPAGLSGALRAGSVRCGDDVFRASGIQVRVTKKGKLLDDGRSDAEGITAGTDVVVVGVRDASTPPLQVGAACRVIRGPARRVGPGHFRAVLACGGVEHEARAVALRVVDAAPALVGPLAPGLARGLASELAVGAPELGCADGRWRDCVKAGNHHMSASDGPRLERGCEAEDAALCRDLGRWLAAYRRETLRELELQERACLLGSRLACFERARARNADADMVGWCDEGFAPACRFLQLLNAPKKREAERWRDKACALDPACGSY